MENQNISEADGFIESEISKTGISNRQIFLWGQIDDASARYVISRLLYLNHLDPTGEIMLILNSPGGLNTSGFAILDVMNMIQAPVSTLCMGLAASFGALILLSGKKGRRFVTPNARVMIHQPWIPGKIEGAATDLAIHAGEILKQRNLIDEIIAAACNRSVQEIAQLTERDTWFNAKEAVEYGLVDAIRFQLNTE